MNFLELPHTFWHCFSPRSKLLLQVTLQLNLQSGMAVTANIKLRTRPALTVVTDIFTRQLDGVKTFR